MHNGTLSKINLLEILKGNDQELRAISIELLEKSGLKEMYDHLTKLA